MSDLAYLSAEAHKAALKTGALTPAERYEFNHLRMVVINDIPVFDETRMRDDQVWETCERLRQITGRMPAKNVRDQVIDHMAAYGKFGLRIKDICEDLAATKPIVLKYLRELAEDGKVIIREETTRGATGSKRKRYFWVDSGVAEARFEEISELGDGLHLLEWGGGKANTNIIHHGAAVYGLSCPCYRCTTALMDEFAGIERSAALRRGETGLSAGLELRRVRREAEYRADGEALAAGLAARNGS